MLLIHADLYPLLNSLLNGDSCFFDNKEDNKETI